MKRVNHGGMRAGLAISLVALALLLPGGTGAASAVTGPSASTATTPAPAMVALPWQASTGILPTSGYLGPTWMGRTVSTVITLNVQNPEVLNAFVAGVSDPYSGFYGHYLTEAQFTQAFSPPASVDTQLTAWLEANGLQVTYVSPDHRSLFVSGTLQQYANTFHISFGEYSYAPGSSTQGSFFAPMETPSVPQTYAPWIESLAGLSNQKVPVTDFAVQYMGGASPQAGSAGQKKLTPDPTFHQIYQLDQLYNSTGNATSGVQPSYAVGTSVAPDLWNSTPNGGAGPCIYDTSDLNTFFNTSQGYPTGLPAVKVQPHYGVPSWPGIAPNTNTCPTAATGGADGEVAMDFEAASSTAPGTNLSYTWVGASGSWAAFIAMLDWLTSNDEAGVGLHLTAISQSWGAPEQYDCSGGPCLSTTYSSDYTQLAAMGVSVFASSADQDGTIGNTGRNTCPTGTGDTPTLQEPGSFAGTMSVGGIGVTSTLPGTTAGDLAGAQVWNWGCIGGTGSHQWVGSQGGVSRLFPEQAWQYGYNVNSSMAFGIASYKANGGTTYSATSARPAPDWSGPADNLPVYVEGGWQTGWGGTSDSSPATAGVVSELSAFDGHSFGLIAPVLYSLANENLSGKLPGVPTLPALEPTYQIQNWSNDATGQAGTGIANFHAATNYNLSTGWGVPLSWNLANLLGKPWIASNPESEPVTGSNYAIAATVQDYRPVSYVNVTYQAPGATSWSNLTLTLSTGNTNKGSWTGSIPGSALTTTGELKYCVYAIDSMEGNSWSPWNQSGWVANGHGSALPWTLFGCNHPFLTYVAAVSGGMTAGTVTLNRSSNNCETACGVALNATYSGGTSTYSAAIRWDDGSATQTITGISGLNVFATHRYTAAGSYTPKVFINDSAAHTLSESTASPLTVYAHVAVAPISVSSWHGLAPANLTFSGGAASSGLGPYTYAWSYVCNSNFPASCSNSSTTASGAPFQIFLHPGNFSVSLKVTDSLAYSSSFTASFSAWGNSSLPLALSSGWNLVALPLATNDYTLFELALELGGSTLGAPLLSLADLHGGTATAYARGGTTGNTAVPAGDALWVDLSAPTSLMTYGLRASSISGVAFTGSTWSGVGWSITGTTTASGLAALLGAPAGLTAVSEWNAATQSWSTYLYGFDSPGGQYDFTLTQGTAVYLWTWSSGTFLE